MKPSVHPSIHPSSAVHTKTKTIANTKRGPWRDYITTATNTTTTDADDKTEHIIMTAMKYLVHLDYCRQSTHPSPFPFPFPSTASTSTSATTVQYHQHTTLPSASITSTSNQSQNYAQSRDRRTQLSHLQDYYGLGYYIREGSGLFREWRWHCFGSGTAHHHLRKHSTSNILLSCQDNDFKGFMY